MPQPFTLTQAEAERALATGLIRALSPSGTYWTTHRNGRTKTWVTRPGEFRIPVKVGFRSFSYIDQDSHFCRPGDGAVAEFLLESMCTPAAI